MSVLSRRKLLGHRLTPLALASRSPGRIRGGNTPHSEKARQPAGYPAPEKTSAPYPRRPERYRGCGVHGTYSAGARTGFIDQRSAKLGQNTRMPNSTMAPRTTRELTAATGSAPV
jgi:hypothetical protein